MCIKMKTKNIGQHNFFFNLRYPLSLKFSDTLFLQISPSEGVNDYCLMPIDQFL
jgi:hypothetical protein